MTDTNVFQLSQPGTFADPLTEVLRNGARALLAQAVEAEVAALLSCHADKLTDDGRQRLVRHGHLPEREIVTGIGPVAVRCPRVRDRSGTGEERIRFTSAILPPYARRSKSLEVLIPILYLKGINFFNPLENTLLRALQNPRVNIAGVRRADLSPLLDDLSPDRLSRQLRRLRDIGVIKRVARSYRYYLTRLGRAAIAAACRLTQTTIIPALA